MSDKPDKKRFSVTLARPVLDELDLLVEAGSYIDQQDVIRDALRHLLQSYGLGQFMTPESPEGLSREPH